MTTTGVAAVSLPAGAYHVKMEHPLLETTSIEYLVEDPSNGVYRPFQVSTILGLSVSA